VADEGDESDAMPTKNLTHVFGFVPFGNLYVTSAPRASKIQEYLNHSMEKVKDSLRWQ
jgi:hypothetical protein